MRHVAAVVGLSGVGKSTAVHAIARALPLLHVQASDLIKAEQARRGATISSSEGLRLGPVLDNQQLLIDGFAHATSVATGLIIFDGHAVVFGQSGAVEIPTTVFGSLGVSRIIMLEADPALLRSRRLADTQRIRPDLGTAALDAQQTYAREVAANIAHELSIPFDRIDTADLASLIPLLSN